MFALTASARRASLVAIALFVSLVAALLVGPAAANAAPAHHHGHKTHHSHKHHARKHHAHKHHATATRSASRVLTPEQAIANSLLNMLNQEREANGRTPLTMNADLIKSAHVHNLAMARTNVMSHQENGEADLATRISRTGYKWSWAGENIGWNSVMNLQGVEQLETMMYNEKAPNDGHRLNILNTHFKNIGVDVYMDNVNHKVWLTTDFGRH